jgi:HEAT repeat protein
MPLIRKPVDQTRAAPAAPTAVDALSALKSTDPDERWAAARAASAIPESAAALAAALRSEPEARVRQAMFTSLGRIGSADALEALSQMLRADDASLRTGALDTLRTLSVALREYLPILLNDADTDVRVLSCELARSLPAEDASRMLCDLLTSEKEPNVCAAALDVLAEVGGAEALPTLALCRARFRDTPFLVFAIKIATDRIASQSAHRHV